MTLSQPGPRELPASGREELAGHLAGLGLRVEGPGALAEGTVELTLEGAGELADEGRPLPACLRDPAVALARRVRVRGLGDALLHDWRVAFERLAAACAGTVELCPTDERGCATGILVEWLLGGFGDGCAALFGTGRLAATEQVCAALVVSLEDEGFNLSGLPALRRCWATLKLPPVSAHAPVAGPDIYRVESGVHVDGILKDPTNYEPLPPEAVGARRAIVLGKHSGRSSVTFELARLGVRDADDALVRALLGRVRAEATQGSGLVSPERFAELAAQEGALS